MIDKLFFHFEQMSDAQTTDEIEESVARLRELVLSDKKNPCHEKEREWDGFSTENILYVE